MTLELTPQSTPLSNQSWESAASDSSDRLKELNKFRNSQDGKALVAWIRQSHASSKTDREKIRRQWMINYAFYRSQQRYDELPASAGAFAGKLITLDKKVHRVINRIKPAVRADIAALISQKPSATVVPATSEDQDLFAAMAGEQVFEAMYYRAKVQQAYMTAAMWTAVTGTGYFKDYWDPALFDRDSGVFGDVVVEAVSPFHIFVPDLLELDIENQPWVIHSYSKGLEWVKMRYEAELAGIPAPLQPSSSTGTGFDYEDQAFKIEGQNKQAKADSCVVIEMWIKPGAHKLFPMGGLVTLVEDIIVQARFDGLPYHHGETPFTKLDNVPTGTFYSDTSITDLVELQRDYNKIRSQIAESIRKVSRIQMISPRGSVIVSKWTNETGAVIEYTPGMQAPAPFPVQELPGYLFQELQQILTDIEDISGQHQVSKGSAPPGVTAATAISFLQERDDAYRATMYQSAEHGMEKLGRHLLSHGTQYWDTPRLVKELGADSAFDAQVLLGSDFARGTDLRIEPGSALPKSRAARSATILELMNMGHIPSEEGLKMMEIGGTQNIVENLRQDERQAQRENIRFKNLDPEAIEQFNQQWEQMAQMGDPSTVDSATGSILSPPPVVSVNTWDNHEVHIQIHNKFRKSQAFELLPDEIKQALEQHVNQHKQVMMQDQIDQFMQGIPGDGSDEEGAMDIVGMAGESASAEAMMGTGEAGAASPGTSPEEAPPEEMGAV